MILYTSCPCCGKLAAVYAENDFAPSAGKVIPYCGDCGAALLLEGKQKPYDPSSSCDSFGFNPSTIRRIIK